MSSRARSYLSAYGVLNALGSGKSTVLRGLLAGDSAGMVLEDHWFQLPPQDDVSPRLARVGRVAAELPELPAAFARYRCRNNQLLLAALAQIEHEVEAALTRWGASRIGVVL